MKRLETTLCLLKKENEILLAMKKEGKKIKAYFDFDEDWNLLSNNIEETNVYLDKK